MLTLSPDAAAYLATAREQSGIPQEALVRIAPTAPGAGELGLGFVDRPADDDQIGEEHGVGYCVASEIADDLGQATLDLAPDGTGLTLVPSA